MRRVVVTGMGIWSPIGNSLDEVSQALRTGVSGIVAVPEWERIKGLRPRVAGTVKDVPEKEIPRAFRRTMGRMAILGALAARDAVAAAGLDSESLTSERVGVAMGSTTGSVPALDELLSYYRDDADIDPQEGTLFMKAMGHTVAANVAAYLGTRGHLLSPCSACASSTQAIGLGFELIQAGVQDVMVCGGADDLHPSTAGVFDVVHAASKGFNDAPERTPRPFDRDRDGLVVGEGGCALILEDFDRARDRGATMLGEVLSYVTGRGTANMTSPDADSMLRCMKRALDHADVAPRDVDYVNAHATATLMGDIEEARALRDLFGDGVPVGATKGYTGHTLAACGAMEAVFSLLMMGEGFLAASHNLDTIDPECAGLNHLLEGKEAQPRVAMSSNFAFGGVNATLVLGRAPE
ncbi:MAG: beta-ketoacyl-[acyl-carrier-protein] synthase family protein [bacterium]|nr:beta-ketoacyl-[acyl-carrier-protein] synthase family protein [bacterium]